MKTKERNYKQINIKFLHIVKKTGKFSRFYMSRIQNSFRSKSFTVWVECGVINMEEKKVNFEESALIPVRQKRNYLEIIYDILSSIPDEGIKMTHLANRALLDYKIMVKYLKQLEREGHVTINSKVYITEKGKIFLEEYKRLKSLISSSKTN